MCVHMYHFAYAGRWHAAQHGCATQRAWTSTHNQTESAGALSMQGTTGPPQGHHRGIGRQYNCPIGP